MNYSEEFKVIVSKCKESGSHLGGGNPNAKILLVGKESATEEKEDWYINNAKDWSDKILNKQEEFDFKRFEKFSSQHTWSQYQKLHNFIFPEHLASDFINFEERIFTTEMNDNPSLNTKDAILKKGFKEELQIRKNTFFKENFIQNFPIIVLACSGYIKNNEKNREIDEIFNVSYLGDVEGKFWFNNSNWFYLHYNQDKTKLVIHTRQLSNRVNGEMLKKMGEVIRKHLIKNHLI